MNEILVVSVVAGCVIEKEGKYLVVQEKNPKVYGLWNLPAGHVDKGESIEAAALREAYEETGYEVVLDGKISVEHPGVHRPVLHAFRARIVGGELAWPPDELLDAKWLTLREIEALEQSCKMRNDWVLRSIRLSAHL